MCIVVYCTGSLFKLLFCCAQVAVHGFRYFHDQLTIHLPLKDTHGRRTTLDVFNKKYFWFRPDLNFWMTFSICWHLVLISCFMFSIFDSILKREHFPMARPVWIRSRFLILFATGTLISYLIISDLKCSVYTWFRQSGSVPQMVAELVRRHGVTNRLRLEDCGRIWELDSICKTYGNQTKAIWVHN